MTMYHLLHYRYCRQDYWKDCKTTLHRVKDTEVVRYEARLVKRLLDLPLTDILTFGDDLETRLINWESNWTPDTQNKRLKVEKG